MERERSGPWGRPTWSAILPLSRADPSISLSLSPHLPEGLPASVAETQNKSGHCLGLREVSVKRNPLASIYKLLHHRDTCLQAALALMQGSLRSGADGNPAWLCRCLALESLIISGLIVPLWLRGTCPSLCGTTSFLGSSTSHSGACGYPGHRTCGLWRAVAPTVPR